jgi:hypothetical protein
VSSLTPSSFIETRFLQPIAAKIVLNSTSIPMSCRS